MRTANLQQIILSGFYVVIVSVILTLTGVFNTFVDNRTGALDMIIDDTLSLNAVILALMLGGAGYVAARRARAYNLAAMLAAGAFGGLLCALALAALVLINISVDMSFVLPNMGSLNESTLTLQRKLIFNGAEIAEVLVGTIAPGLTGLVAMPQTDITGLLLLLRNGVLIGLGAGLLVYAPDGLSYLRRTDAVQGMYDTLVKAAAERLIPALLVALALVIVMGLVVNQLNEIITLPDALALALPFALAYLVARLALPRFALPAGMWGRVGAGFVIGAAIGGVLAAIAGAGGLDEGGILRGVGSMPTMLNMAVDGRVLLFLLVIGMAGVLGVLAVEGSTLMHNGVFYFLAFLLTLGVLNWQGQMTLSAALLIFVLLALLLYLAPLMGERAQQVFDAPASSGDQQLKRFIFTMVALGVLTVAPQFVNLYVANVMNWIALYIIMGIGLNVMIGFTGLLDLGYVASFAIGAYTLGLLTAPNILTCGGVQPDDIPFTEIEQACTGMMTFWQAWPFCVVVSAFTGMALGVPVLGLRGDYLAIVTLGFGEITNRIINSNAARPLLGGAQGISPIPTPELNLTAINDAWFYNLNNSTNIYYLYLFCVIVTAFIVYRLATSRLGRAWRAIRADEDVAEAMGIHLVRYKLLAFGVSSAFAGLGGAVFGAQLQGIFPNSFTILVSINVLSLIIMGGMGSIPGVVIGAMILVGLPELLRELDSYRLLGFGALLVIVMLTKPEGLLPPKPAKLSDKARPNQSGYPLPVEPDDDKSAAPIKKEGYEHGTA